MFCFQCGKEIPKESKFCLYCGAQLSDTEEKEIEGADIDPLFEDCFIFLRDRLVKKILPLSEVSDAYVTYDLPPERFLDFYHQILESGVRIIDDSSDQPAVVIDENDEEYSERDAFEDCIDELVGATDHGTLYINDVADFYDDHVLPAEWYDEFLKALEARNIILFEDDDDVEIKRPQEDEAISEAAEEACKCARTGTIKLEELIAICIHAGVAKTQFETVLNKLHEKGIEVDS
ncbi:MAG: zinc ribbon domain-containing protein [Dialister sp.]|nr:zinc ribbon domain-containing protein [Dialister sp.]